MQRQVLSSIAKSTSLHRAILRPAVSVSTRDVSTFTVTPAQEQTLLNKQRDIRPNSPWTIYQIQLTSMSSIVNRGTGVGLSAGIYALFLGHLILPAVGVPFDSATIVSVFAESPEWFKIAAKSLVAFPATFHTINGFRHLSWDAGYLLSLKSSYAAGYAVIASSIASGLALVFYV